MLESEARRGETTGSLRARSPSDAELEDRDVEIGVREEAVASGCLEEKEEATRGEITLAFFGRIR